MIIPYLRTGCIALLLNLTCHGVASTTSNIWQGGENKRISSSHKLFVGEAVLQVDFAAGTLDLSESELLGRVQTAASAVSLYYGRFPVSKARILIVPVAGEEGVLQGTTWENRQGFPAFTRLRIGEHTTHAELRDDWIMTHEMVHMAMASLPDSQHWLEEGLATYIEPIARAQNHELTPERVWGDMMRGMPQGEPGPGDRGLNHTTSWGRTYWGGAMFCLLADIELHEQTHNRQGLQDALRAIVRAGGTLDSKLTLQQILKIGDQATGTKVLQEMYRSWSDAPVSIDLNRLWGQLGIQNEHGHISFKDECVLASIRLILTAPPMPERTQIGDEVQE